ncbi:MAG: type II toxin-antitoxin system RelB/DinJ family antitoxin [Desulfamplus sp.]|nr:type II toxin-antitoxin system RelB/DinJ family antitoxin [Desulfamplus sp.]
MTTESIVSSLIDVKIKNEAAQILESMGLTISDGIRLFLYQVIV